MKSRSDVYLIGFFFDLRSSTTVGHVGADVVAVDGECATATITDYVTSPAIPSGVSYDVVLEAFSQEGAEQV